MAARGLEKLKNVSMTGSTSKRIGFEAEDKLLLGMVELNQRGLELEITENEWLSTWMLCRVKKRKRMDVFEYTELRNVVKEGGEDVIKNFQKKYRELKVEGSQKRIAETNYVEKKETLYMGSESESRRRYQNNRYQRDNSYRRNESYGQGRPRSSSRGPAGPRRS